MLTELRGKGGQICQPALDGKLRCPLIIRPRSEDVITGNLFGTLELLNPRYWVPDLLNEALGEERFRRQFYREFKVELWPKQPRFPRANIPWAEGNTEVDVVLSWENPPTTVFIEMKYRSPVSAETAMNNGRHGYPSDQIIRNIRVGLWQCGWMNEMRLFPRPRRDFVFLLITPEGGNELLDRYRDPKAVKRALPYGEEFEQPKEPFVGELSYRQINALLQSQHSRFNRTEQRLIDRVGEYLEVKLAG